MANDEDIEITCAMNACEKLWVKSGRELGMFSNWEFRRSLSELSSMTPCFIANTTTGTILPAGSMNGTLYFYGGLHYNERNGFIGPSGGEKAIFEFLRRERYRFRLLSWEKDPMGYLPSSCAAWDVPYNQYWVLSGFRSYDEFLMALSPSRRKEARYLLRRFTVHYDDDGSQVAPEVFSLLMDQTVESFQKRGRRCIYEGGHFRTVANVVLSSFRDRKMLRTVQLSHQGHLVGMGILGEDSTNMKAAYLFNLYAGSPNDVSAAVLLAAIRYCTEKGLMVDGMRGAFSLKRKYGFQPEPSYAIVNDETWQIRQPNDLPQEELEGLYKRKFGSVHCS